MEELILQATLWVEEQEQLIRATGNALNHEQQAIARHVGVAHPERIYIKEVDVISPPENPMLRKVAHELDFLGFGTIGLTLGYSVFLKRGHIDTRLLSHEFRHVKQYEDAGSVKQFIAEYLQQILQYGYRDSLYEVDARAHEISNVNANLVTNV